MKNFLCCLALLSLLNCNKPSETTSGGDTTQYASGSEVELTEEALKGAELLTRYLQGFEVAKDSYPYITFSQGHAGISSNVTYYFEDDNLTWVQVENLDANGVAENVLINRDPEGTFYLRYGTNIDGAFGYSGMEEGDWYAVKPDADYMPFVVGMGTPEKYDYQTAFDAAMIGVRENKDNFTLENGVYEYIFNQGGTNSSYQLSEVLFGSNMLSATGFDPNQIKAYLNWWYPVYSDTSAAKMYRHKLCTGDEDYIKITAEAGNYRWEEELSGKTIVYKITAFEESEGDAFYATIERNGTSLKKTLIIPEFEGEANRLYIDGKVYTSDPSQYDVVTLKCN